MEKTVAIVGYSFRFPSTTKAQFWQDLLDKKDLITEVSEDRWSKESYLHPDKRHPGTSYSFAAGSIGDIASFDAGFFGLSPREVQHMDPQQRLLLEMTWEAIESANIRASDLRGSDCGVYMGVAAGDFADTYADDPCAIEANTATGSTNSIAANRISYLFDLHGPSLAIDTACSSSMVAFHQACRAIQTGEVPMALTGGISIHAHPSGFLVFSKATMLSPTGRCHVFDADADGYVRSEGGGVFLLKDYQQAKADGDKIIALVAGTAVNTDGNKSGLTIPNPKAQIALMEKVYQQAGIAADAVSYLEAHGTGTPVGDPIEVQAIASALGKKRRTPLPIGSVKSNLGHLETASGVAGLVKALLTLQHRQVPATISMKTPNPNIPFAELNVQVVTEALALPASGQLTVGINSFGFGGANAHVILQSPPEEPLATQPATDISTDSLHVPLQITARSNDALKAQARQLAGYLAESSASLYDIGWTLKQRREHHEQGALLFARDRVQAQASLTAFAETGEAEGVYLGDKVAQAKGPAFVYSGNGCQWETMGQQLLQQSDLFRETVSRVDAIFQRYADFSIVDELQGNNGLNRFHRTEIAQPALFAVQVGLTEMLAEQGIVAQVVTGHSVGEVAAAWASGALSLEQAVKVIYHRSLHQGRTAGQGQMTAVALSAEAIQVWLDKPEYQAVQLSGINSPNGVTLAGEEEALTRLEIQLKGQGVRLKRLDLDYAFHSAQMDSIEAGVREDLADLTPTATHKAYISTVTGELLTGESLDAEYWWHNIRQPVQFEKAISSILDQGVNTFVEIGAHPVLSGYLREILRDAEQPGQAIATLMRQQGQLCQVEQAVAQCLLSGAISDLTPWFPVEGQSVDLPAYPWQREAYWHATTPDSQGLLSRYSVHPLLGYRTPQRQPTWQNDLDTQRHPWLADHKVGEGVVFPGAGFVELVLAAITELRGQQLFSVEDLEILSPLLLDDQHTKRIQVQMDPLTGAVRVFSQEKLRSDDWNLHLKARALKETLGHALQQQAPSLPQRAADFTRADHLELAASIGLDYGPAFQAISKGWIEGKSVVGVFDLPDIIQADQPKFWLHPGVLDSAFQLFVQLLKNELSRHQGIAFVPTQIAAITLDTSQADSQPGLTRVTLLKYSPHSLLARVEIFSSDQRPLVVLEGVRFRAVPLRRSSQQVISQLNYVTVPVALAAQVLDDEPAARWEAQLLDELRQQPELQTYVQETEPLLDALVESFVLHMLAELADDQGIIRDWPDNACARRWLAQAKSEGWLGDSPEGILLQKYSDVPPDVIWNMLIQEYPAYAALTQRVGSSGRRLLQRLQSENACQSVPDPLDYAQALRMMLGEQTLSMLSVAYSRRLAEQQRQLDRTERLRIVEISSGQPLLMDAICRKLDFNLCDYTYLSSNPDTLAELQPHSQDYPLMQLGRFDPVTGKITLPVADSLAPIHQVFIHLDFISLSDVQAILRQLRSALHPQARVMLLAQQPALWLDFVFGHTENWWVSEDQSQQASPEQWQELLQELGYEQVCIEHLTDNNRGAVMLMARAPLSEKVQPELESWYLLSDNTPEQQVWTNALSSQLQAAGIQVEVIDTSAITTEAAVQLSEHLTDQLSASASQDTVHWLLFSGLGDPDLVEGQTRRCRLAAELVRTLEWHETAEDTRVLLLTRQVANGYVPELVAAEPCADYAFWGFGRTLINESSKIPVALIDLPQTAAQLQPAVETLIQVAQSPKAEDELFIMPEGGCIAPRLRNLTRPAIAAKQITEEASPTRVLGFDLPGQLRNLYWKCVRLPVPDAGQVVVEVKATGLNFRDVMFALGLLSDEAIENGFSGPTLGLEFAGVVIEKGKDVTEFNLGDRVVGFGPASFTTRVCTGINSIIRMPASFDFAAAATIPTTFFTVYYALKHLARLEPGERLLIHGAAGGVGLAAIQIARLMGAEIYATVGSESKQDFISLLGENRLYDSRSVTFAEAILEDTPDGQGVDVVLNSLAGEAINQNLRVLKPFGRFLELGKRDFYENTAIGLRPFRNNISYFGIDTDQLMKVRPDLTQRLFSEMMALFDSGELYPLPYTQFHADQVVEAFRYMQQARQIGKVIITYPQPPYARLQPRLADPLMDSPLLLDAQGAYLVTGGLSGFGLKTAHWLVEKGARKLALISRSGQVPEQDQASLDALKAKGVELLTCACDVTDRDALARLIQQVGQTLAPLKGVVHAAAYYHDGLINQLTESAIADVFRVKMLGAQYLHELTDNLDLFVLFSSATTLFGNPGQASYVAANHWLEGLAMTRYYQGLPVTCVRWGAIDDVGYLARHSKIKEALEGRMGGHALNSTRALAELEKLLQSGQPLTAVMELEWHALARFLPGATAAKYRELAATAHDQEGGEDHLAELQLMLDTLEPQALQDAITQMLKAQLSKILLISEEKLEVNRSVYDMGFDSLMAVELVTAIENRFGVHLPVMALSESPTLTQLAQRLISLLKGDEQDNVSESDQLKLQLAQQYEVTDDLALDTSTNQLASSS